MTNCPFQSILVAIFAIAVNRAEAELTQPEPEILPDLYTWTDTCNVHILRDGDKALLINLGDGTVLEELDKIGVKSVEWVLFTDHHRELSQGIHRIDRKLTKIAAPKAEQEIFENPTYFRKWFPKLGDKYTVHAASYVRPPRSPIKVDRALIDGDVFEWGVYSIRCLSTPGHSPGGMTYIVEKGEDSIAFTGGLMHDGAKFTNWYDTEWDYGFAKGIDTLIDSINTLSKLDLAVALPSQGPPISSPVKQFEQFAEKLTTFRASYIRGYPVSKMEPEESDPISKPTASEHINQVTPHLYKLSRQTKGKNFAIIIADSGKGLVLDCGLFPELMLHKMIHDLRTHMGLKEIDAMWISHMHGDHFLLGPALKKHYGTKMWTLDRIADVCENPRHYDYAALVSSYNDGFDGMKIDKKFRDGESVEWEGYKIQVDWMPGQTEFGCCLWLDIDGKRVAFTGDNLFANSADETQDGHEAVVARNSAIFEEGYLLGSKYLKELNPDIVMGSHSFVMPEPEGLLDRYHQWSKKIIALYKDLLPDKDYEYLFDPYWVSAYPYRVDLTKEKSQTITVTVRNFRSAPQRHHIELKLPEGIKAEPSVLEGVVEPESRERFEVALTADGSEVAGGVQIAPFDITLDGKKYGELFDFLILGEE